MRDGTYSTNTFLSSGPLLTGISEGDVGYRKLQSDRAPSICVAKDGSGAAIYRGLGWKDVSAVIVTIAVVDGATRKILTDSNVTAIAGKFDDSTSSGSAVANYKLPMEVWATKINQSSLGSEIPKKAVGGIRVYQRSFYLNTL
jgi:hypothetical protein